MNATGLTEQRQMAIQDLMDRYLIAKRDDPISYHRIAMHESYLKGWFWDRPQWRLLSGRGIFRLERTPSLMMAGRGLPRLRSPLAYACLCWTLWFAEVMATSSRDWFVISDLADRITAAAEGLFTLAERRHREALVQALQLLVDLGGLLLRDGDTERWIAGQAATDDAPEVIYEFADNAPRLLANFSYEGLVRLYQGDLAGRTALQTGEQAPALARAWRAVLLGPIFWRHDDPEAFQALERALERVSRDLEQTLSWQLQCNSDYACIWRTNTARHASALLLDLYPESGAANEDRHTRFIYHPILLLLDRLQGEVEAGARAIDETGALPIAKGDLDDLLGDLRSEYRKHWGSELGALSSADLAEMVLAEMRRVGFLRGPDRAKRCYLLPPAGYIGGRYAPEQGATAPAGAPDSGPALVQASLFAYHHKEEP